MSAKALIDLANKIEQEQLERFDKKVYNREVIGYSKGYWLVEYTFKESYGYSSQTEWEQDARSIAHQKLYPED